MGNPISWAGSWIELKGESKQNTSVHLFPDCECDTMNCQTLLPFWLLILYYLELQGKQTFLIKNKNKTAEHCALKMLSSLTCIPIRLQFHKQICKCSAWKSKVFTFFGNCLAIFSFCEGDSMNERQRWAQSPVISSPRVFLTQENRAPVTKQNSQPKLATISCHRVVSMHTIQIAWCEITCDWLCPGLNTSNWIIRI